MFNCCHKYYRIFPFPQKLESRVACDQDLKLADTLRYYMRDSQAARALLVRRLKCLANYENANRTLEKARHKNKDIHAVSFNLNFFKSLPIFAFHKHLFLMLT